MTNKEVIQKMYADFGQGNVPEILNAMADDITIDTPGPAIISWAGERTGKAGAVDFFTQVGTSASYEKFEPTDYIVEGDRVVADGIAHFTSTATGKKGVSRWTMIWTLRNGKAIHVRNLWDTYAITETLKS